MIVVMITILMIIKWKMMVVSAMSTRRVGMMMTRMRMIIRIILMAVVMMIALEILKKLPSEIGSLRNAD